MLTNDVNKEIPILLYRAKKTPVRSSHNFISKNLLILLVQNHKNNTTFILRYLISANRKLILAEDENII